MALNKWLRVNIHSLRQNELIAFQFAHVARSLTTLVLAVLVAKSGWDLNIINRWEQLLLIASQFGFSWLTGGNLGINSLWSSLNSQERKALPFSIYLVYLFLSFVFSFFGVFVFFSELPFPIEFYWSGFLILYWSGFLLDQLLMLHHQKRQLYWSGLWHFFPYLLSIIPVYYAQADILTVIKIWIIIAAVRQFYLIFFLFQNSTLGFYPELIKVWFKKSLPLMLYALISSCTIIVCNLIANHLQPDNFAFYRYGSRDIPFVAVVLASMSNFISYSMNGSLEEGAKQIQTKSQTLLIGIFGLHLALLVFSKPLFFNLFGEKLGQSYTLFNIFLLLVIPKTIFPQTLLTGKGENTIQLLGSVVESMVIIGLSFAFGGQWGLEGIAYAILIGFLFEKLIFIFYLIKKYKFSPSRYIPTKLWIGLSLLLLITFYLSKN